MGSNSLKPGTILKGQSHSYKIEKFLGNGSFGITYLAEVVFNNSNVQSNVRVTIKEFFMKDFNGREGSSVTIGSKNGFFGKYLDKFIKEAENLSRIDSDNVVKVLEVFKTNNTAYYVMQYLSGGSLNDAINRKGQLPEEVALQYILQISNALMDLHNTKMLHLDLKPSNVMLSSSYDAVLIDFGLSKQYTDSGEPESSTTIGCGTMGYASIEQAHYHDGHDFPATMDIYALGATLYKMLTGAVPPDSSSILNDGFPDKALKDAHVSSIVIDFTKRLMSPLKKSRPQNMNQVISELESLCTIIPILDKNDLARWMSLDEKSVVNEDDETDTEIISVDRKVKQRKNNNDIIYRDTTINKIEIRINTDQSKPHQYIWFSITATPKELIVIKLFKNEQFPIKKNFFYSPEKFDTLKQSIKVLNLHTRALTLQEHKTPYGVGIKLFNDGNLVFNAATYDDKSLTLLEGKINELMSLAWKESGLINLNSLTSNKNKIFSKFFKEGNTWHELKLIIGLVVVGVGIMFVLIGAIGKNKNKTTTNPNQYDYSQSHQFNSVELDSTITKAALDVLNKQSE